MLTKEEEKLIADVIWEEWRKNKGQSELILAAIKIYDEIVNQKPVNDTTDWGEVVRLLRSLQTFSTVASTIYDEALQKTINFIKEHLRSLNLLPPVLSPTAIITSQNRNKTIAIIVTELLLVIWIFLSNLSASHYNSTRKNRCFLGGGFKLLLFFIDNDFAVCYYNITLKNLIKTRVAGLCACAFLYTLV